jgi:hypothetical protein
MAAKDKTAAQTDAVEEPLDDQSAVVESDGPVVPDEPPTDFDHRSNTVLAVVEPFWVTAYEVNTDEHGTLVIDRVGTVVPKSLVDDLKTQARDGHDIILAEVSNS